MTKRERELWQSIARALVPSGGPFPLGADEAEVAAVLAEHLRHVEPDIARHMHRLAWVWEVGNALLPPFRRFSQLDPELQQQRLERAYHGRHLLPRLVVEGLKQLVGFAYGAAPTVAAAFATGQPCLDAAPPRRGPRLHPVAFPDLRGRVRVRVDVCVVGSGAGGAVVAAECARAGMRVAVVEEGAYFTQDDFSASPFERMLRMYRNHGATVAVGRPPIPVPLGRAVGGTTVVNSGTCFRAPDEVLDHFVRRYGLDGYEPQAMVSYFERVERELHVMPVPWDIIGANARWFDRGVQQLGLHGEPLRRNILGCRGCGVCAFGCPSDAKQAMHLSYLPRAEASGATIYARCRAEELLRLRGRVAGVRARILGGRDSEHVGWLEVEADKVVVACGALHTPGFLRRNGVRDRSGMLGRNLALHPALAVSASFPERIDHWRGTLQSYFVDHLHRSHGVMIEVTSMHPAMAISAAKGVGRELKEFLADLPYRGSAGLFVSDTSSGEVRSLPGLGMPLVRYSLNRYDMSRLLAGAALVAEIFLAAGAHTVHTGLPHARLVRGRHDLEALADATRCRPEDLHLAAFHPVGTCRMAARATDGVVGLDGQVHGESGLYVADASLFPECIGVNPQETIMAFATRIAEGIAGKLARQEHAD
jgi:choline dehydrogenase-like flavoprotein